MTSLQRHWVIPSHRPRLVLIAGEETLRLELRRSLTGRFILLDGLPRRMGVAGAVLGFPCIGEPEVRRRIRAAREAIQPSPCLLVTSMQTGNLLSLSELIVERVHPLEEGVAALTEVVESMLDLDPLAILSRTVEASKGMDPLVRRAVVLILRSRPPIASVKRLCRELQIGRSTLHDHWSESSGHPPSGVAVVLRQVALYRAGEMMVAGHSVEEAACRVGWSRRRLVANARSLLGSEAADLALELPRHFERVEDFARRLGPGTGDSDESGLPPDTSVLAVPGW